MCQRLLEVTAGEGTVGSLEHVLVTFLKLRSKEKKTHEENGRITFFYRDGFCVFRCCNDNWELVSRTTKRRFKLSQFWLYKGVLNSNNLLAYLCMLSICVCLRYVAKIKSEPIKTHVYLL